MFNWEEMKNKIYNADYKDVFSKLPDKSIDLIIQDPPYNIKKAEWDKFKSKEDYVEWCGLWIKESERLLKDTGSFYFFHNDMTQISMLMEWIRKNTKFIFKQMITWNKRFKDAKNKGFLDGYVQLEKLRNYQLMAEYCLFYTFQDETGLTTLMLDTNNFSTLRQYFKELQEFIGLNLKKINNILGHRKSEHAFYWKTTQWILPTKETYQELIDKFNINKWSDFKEYESLRYIFNNQRYIFNNQKTHHSVWNYDIAKRTGHISPKPVELIENIILHSSNEGDTICDFFGGAGTTAIACINTNRNYIITENNIKNFKIAEKRIKEIRQQGTLF